MGLWVLRTWKIAITSLSSPPHTWAPECSSGPGRRQAHKIRYGRLLTPRLSGISVVLLSAQATKHPIRFSLPNYTFCSVWVWMNQIHLPPRRPMSCCLTIVPPGNAFFTFASALHCLGLTGMNIVSTQHSSRCTGSSEVMEPRRTLGCQ